VLVNNGIRVGDGVTLGIGVRDGGYIRVRLGMCEGIKAAVAVRMGVAGTQLAVSKMPASSKNIVFFMFSASHNYTDILLPCRIHKLPEQIPRGLLIREPFGVPLHGKSKRMVREFNGFDESIWRMASDAK